jgi:hypothetical protein
MVDHSQEADNRYHCQGESELRMERQHILNQRKKLAQINENREISALMAQFKNNKQKILNQIARKHETSRIVAKIHQNKI